MIESSRPSAAFRALFHRHAAPHATMGFDRFMELALYDPEIGYYRAGRPRIGYAADTDFFTASTSGPVFAGLVTAACVSLLQNHNAADYTFVEIGAETAGGILAGVDHPFATTRTLRIGDTLDLSGRCIVFSNELFDAQPFRRFVFRRGAWRELGVALRDDMLIEIELPTPAPSFLPPATADGYAIDAPLEAAALLDRIAAQPWSGLFVAFDYGKSWLELATACPQGTARAYHRHTQSNDLLARPGGQDLTCHVCWDWLAEKLAVHGFATPLVESQESFFIRRATDYIATLSTADAARFSRDKLSLSQLLHPGQLGQKFQVLHAWRH